MSNELSAIPLHPNHIERVDQVLKQNGLRPHFFQNFDAWESGQTTRVEAPATLAGEREQEPQLEDCLLLIGSLDEVAELRMAERIAQRHPGLPIVVVSDSPDVPTVVRVMQQGVTDVVDLNDQPASFLKSVHRALRQGRESRSDRSRSLLLRSRLETLSDAERLVLDCMMDGLANKETAKQLGIGLRTVELRRSKIMGKMGAKSVAELIRLFCEARCPGIDAKAARK